MTSPASTPPPPPSSPKLVPPITAITTTTNDDVSPTKKPQPIPWTHQETVNLIRAYQEKWYAAKRGPLRASQWEEVAVVVAARCGYDFNYPSKSAVQCRHKMEKLRQRHRAEKRQHPLVNRTSSARNMWPYSGLMDELERGPMPISARPIASLAPSPVSNDYNNFHEIDDDDDDDEMGNYKKSKSINYILRQNQRHSKNKHRGIFGEHVNVDVEDDDGDDVKGVEVMDERVLLSGLTSEIKNFAERLIGMENLKMKMMRETQRCRLEMENRRIEMILESRRRTIDSIGRAFGSSKRMKMNEET